MQDKTVRSEPVLRYTLGPADRLAFAILRHELTGWEKFRLLVVVGLAGVAASLLPDDMGKAARWASVAAILVAGAAAAILLSNLEVRRRANRLGIADGAVELHDLGDRLSERSASGVREVGVADIAQVTVTDRHVFIRTGERPVIVPAAAFADREAMTAFAARWDGALQAAAP
ncbi:MAG TPA: hypothetical protein GX405_15960 [Rhizobiales bacterium]|nr:hypothetical protein [Hyphomicrobiales bacterium]